ncbi:hypothetical protein WMY93_006979 [Mugilogobius chulae]|uniref:Ig-like domain-containing protein n=1 Tax=Mugilogobius chulae TaxID=88201 RepID=A0AAW0PPU6_9GOBI
MGLAPLAQTFQCEGHESALMNCPHSTSNSCSGAALQLTCSDFLHRPDISLSASPDEVSPVEVSPDAVSPVEVSPDKVSPVEVSPDKVSPVEVSPDKVSPVPEVRLEEVQVLLGSDFSVKCSIVPLYSGGWFQLLSPTHNHTLPAVNHSAHFLVSDAGSAQNGNYTCVFHLHKFNRNFSTQSHSLHLYVGVSLSPVLIRASCFVLVLLTYNLCLFCLYRKDCPTHKLTESHVCDKVYAPSSRFMLLVPRLRISMASLILRWYLLLSVRMTLAFFQSMMWPPDVCRGLTREVTEEVTTEVIRVYHRRSSCSRWFRAHIYRHRPKQRLVQFVSGDFLLLLRRRRHRFPQFLERCQVLGDKSAQRMSSSLLRIDTAVIAQSPTGVRKPHLPERTAGNPRTHRRPAPAQRPRTRDQGRARQKADTGRYIRWRGCHSDTVFYSKYNGHQTGVLG